MSNIDYIAECVKVYPNAYCRQDGQEWFIFSDTGLFLTVGATETEAWEILYWTKVAKIPLKEGC